MTEITKPTAESPSPSQANITITFSMEEFKLITGAILRAPFLPAKQALEVLNKLVPAGTKV